MSCKPRVLVLLVCLLFTANAFALDGNHQGFMIDLGLGAGALQIPGKTKGAGAATFNIGYGFNNQLMLYYGGKVGVVTEGWNSGSLNVSGLGITYYFADQAPAAFVTGIIGFSRWEELFFKKSGQGISAGFGYEFRKNWSVSGDVILGRIDFGAGKETLKSFRLQFNHHWY